MMPRPVLGAVMFVGAVVAEKTITVDWFEWLKVTGSISLILAGFFFIFRPLYDRTVIMSMKRCAPDFKEFVDGMYAEERRANAAAAALSQANSDSIEFIRASLLAQGEELPKVSLAVERLTIATEHMADAVEKITNSHQTTHDLATRLDERMASWERAREERERNYGGPLRRADDHSPLDP